MHRPPSGRMVAPGGGMRMSSSGMVPRSLSFAMRRTLARAARERRSRRAREPPPRWSERSPGTGDPPRNRLVQPPMGLILSMDAWSAVGEQLPFGLHHAALKTNLTPARSDRTRRRDHALFRGIGSLLCRWAVFPRHYSREARSTTRVCGLHLQPLQVARPNAFLNSLLACSRTTRRCLGRFLPARFI